MEIEEKIDKLVCDYWKDNERPLLLSQLPKRLAEASIEINRPLGQGYLDFLRSLNLKETTIGRATDAPNDVIWALFPRTVSRDDAFASLKHLRRDTHGAKAAQGAQADRTDVAAIDRVVYHPPVWNAFTTPISNGFRRVFFTQPQLRYADMPESEEVPDNAFMIPRDLLEETLVTKSPSTTAQVIRRWATEAGVPEDTIVKPKPRDFSARECSSELLAKALSRLSPADLSKVSVPLDVVLKMLH